MILLGPSPRGGPKILILRLCSGEAQFWDLGIGAKVLRGDTWVGPQGRDWLEAEVKGDRQSGTIVNPKIKLSETGFPTKALILAADLGRKKLGFYFRHPVKTL